MARRFNVAVSNDRGDTWKRSKAASGWAVGDLKAPEEFGYVIAIDYGDTMLDVEIPERVLKLMLKDVVKAVKDAEAARREVNTT